ncbi:unnamed protein product, partial [Meganyctiphanes norvegica]
MYLLLFELSRAMVAHDKCCNEDGCGKQFKTIDKLRKHLVSEHQQHHPEEVLHFPSLVEYEKWKSTYEEDRLVKFIISNRNYNKAKGEHVKYLVCNRNPSKKKSVSKRKRRPRDKGTVGMDKCCTCTFTLISTDEWVKV